MTGAFAGRGCDDGGGCILRHRNNRFPQDCANFAAAVVRIVDGAAAKEPRAAMQPAPSTGSPIAPMPGPHSSRSWPPACSP